MPTRTITSRVDLETERQTFLLYEQRIIQERNEILLNMRNHLDQLDGEIIRLGGVSRDALPSTRGRTCSRAAALDYVPSVAPFPPVISSSTTTARGGGGKKGGLKENNNGNNNNKGGSISPSYNNNPKKKPPRKQRRRNNTNTGFGGLTPAEIHNGQPWQCGCGERLSGDRARCGKCKKWKGGVRPPPIGGGGGKSSSPTPSAAALKKVPPPSSSSSAGSSSSSSDEDDNGSVSSTTNIMQTVNPPSKQPPSSPVTIPSVIDVYTSLAPVHHNHTQYYPQPNLSDDEGAMILSGMASGEAVTKHNRSEVEKCMGDLVFAVVTAGEMKENYEADKDKEMQYKTKKLMALANDKMQKEQQGEATAKKKKKEKEKKKAAAAAAAATAAKEKDGKAKKKKKGGGGKGKKKEANLSSANGQPIASCKNCRAKKKKCDGSQSYCLHKDLHTKGGGGKKKDTNVVAPANAVGQKGGGKKGNNNTRKRGRSKGGVGGGPSDNDAAPIQRVVSTSSDSDLSAVGGGACDGLGGQMMMQATTGGSRDKLASDCLQYFTQIQQELLSTKPHLFNALVNATGEFASGEVDHVEFVGHMISLLDGHTNLIMGLNRVLPVQFKIEAADLQASFFPAQEGREEEEGHKPKRRRTKTPKVKVETDNTQGVVSTTLASAAKSGCRKCTEELATGVKTRREHDDGCPRKQRRRSSSSSSGRSSKSSSSRSA